MSIHEINHDAFELLSIHLAVTNCWCSRATVVFHLPMSGSLPRFMEGRTRAMPCLVDPPPIPIPRCSVREVRVRTGVEMSPPKAKPATAHFEAAFEARRANAKVPARGSRNYGQTVANGAAHLPVGADVAGGSLRCGALLQSSARVRPGPPQPRTRTIIAHALPP